MSQCHRLGTMPNPPIPQSHFCVQPNPSAHLATRFSKAILRDMAVPLLKHRNIWQSTLHMNGYCVVGVVAIPYPGVSCIITTVSKEERTYLVSIADNPQCLCTVFVKMASMIVGKRGWWVSCKHLYHVFMFFATLTMPLKSYSHTHTQVQ